MPGLNPICIKCKRVILKKDKAVLQGEHKVHAPGFCRGPHVKRWYVVAYNSEGSPVSVGRVPDTAQELRDLADSLVQYDIRLAKLNHRRLTTIVNAVMGSPA